MGKLCSRCSAILETTSIAALGHNYVGWTMLSEATCTTDGVTIGTCSRCGATDTIITAATGHSYVTVEEVAATCTTEGSITQLCTICGHKETTVTPVTEHTYVYEHNWNSLEVVETEGTVEVTVTCSKCDLETTTTHTIQIGPDMEELYCVECDKDVTDEYYQ